MQPRRGSGCGTNDAVGRAEIDPTRSRQIDLRPGMGRSATYDGGIGCQPRSVGARYASFRLGFDALKVGLEQI